MRYASIDILRTLAIFVMVLVHFGENLAGYKVPVAGFGAPLFALLSGVGYSLWLRGQHRREASEEHISKVSIRRGLFVLGVGFAFNILVWLPEDTFNWDVLTLIGVALLILNYLRRFPASVSLTVAAVALFLSPVFRAMAEYDLYWVNGYFDGDLTLSDILLGFSVTGYFPLFPWIAFSIVGYVTGGYLFGSNDQAYKRTALTGAGLLAASLLLLAVRPEQPGDLSKHLLRGWTMYPATIEYVLGTLGISLLLLGVLHKTVDLNPASAKHERALGVATLLSRHSFTIYLLHHVVHLWPLWIYGMATGNKPTEFWMKAMPASVSIALALLFMVVCYYALRAIGPNRRIGAEAWMRWLCD